MMNDGGTPSPSLAGYFDQQFRQSLFISWASHLQEANISFRTDLARVEVSCLPSLPLPSIVWPLGDALTLRKLMLFSDDALLLLCSPFFAVPL